MAKDPRYENWFERLRVESVYLPTLSIARIDLAQSLRNQARLVAIDPDRVRDYAAKMRDGVVFPAVIVYKDPNGIYVLISGNHRVTAAKEAGKQDIDAYYVKTADTDLYVREMMTRSANDVEGVNLTQDEKLYQAVHMLQKYGHSIVEVAAHFGLQRDALSREYARIGIDRRLSEHGFSPPRPLGREQKAPLARIQSDKVMLHAADTIAEGRMPPLQVKEMVNTVIRAGSEEDQIQAVAEYRKSPSFQKAAQETLGGKVEPALTIQKAVYRHLEGLNRLVRAHPDPEGLQMTDTEDVRRLRELWGPVAFAMNRIIRRDEKGHGAGDTAPGGAAADGPAAGDPGDPRGR